MDSYVRDERAKLRWTCDLDVSRAAERAETYNVPKHTANFHEVLADPNVQAVSVCTDHANHAELVIAALQAGKHVVCEKPLGVSRQELSDMLAARRDGQVFSGVFQHRFDRAYQVARNYLRDGALGTLLTAGARHRCLRTEAYYKSDPWRGTWAGEGGSALINQAIHILDILGWITGGVQRLCGTWTNRAHQNLIETEDCAAAVLQFANGAVGSFDATSGSPLGWENILELHGTTGTVVIRDGVVRTLRFNEEETARAFEADLEASKPEEPVAGKSYWGLKHAEQISDFLSAIKNQRQPYIPADSAAHAVEMVLAVYESQKTGGWVELQSRP
jgi:predicted dehydrogenase